MVDTCYLHLEFKSKSGEWAVNLPFLCTKCGVCCKLDDFLTAGPIKATQKQQPQIHAQLKAIYDMLSELLEKGQEEYDQYVTQTPCPFLKNQLCSIYPFRPEGCRMFPNTAFAMLSEDCEALERFKLQRKTLRRGRSCKETFYSTLEPTKPAKYTQKQYQKCLEKLMQTDTTKEELALFEALNRKQEGQQKEKG